MNWSRNYERQLLRYHQQLDGITCALQDVARVAGVGGAVRILDVADEAPDVLAVHLPGEHL